MPLIATRKRHRGALFLYAALMKLMQPTIQSLRLPPRMGKLLDEPLAFGYGTISTLQESILHSLP
jgi:hypothetical protein